MGKNLTICEIISNFSAFPKIVVKSKIGGGGGSEILEKKSYIVNFFFDLKMDGTQLFGRPITSYSEAKTILYPPH